MMMMMMINTVKYKNGLRGAKMKKAR